MNGPFPKIFSLWSYTAFMATSGPKYKKPYQIGQITTLKTDLTHASKNSKHSKSILKPIPKNKKESNLKKFTIPQENGATRRQFLLMAVKKCLNTFLRRNCRLRRAHSKLHNKMIIFQRRIKSLMIIKFWSN